MTSDCSKNGTQPLRPIFPLTETNVVYSHEKKQVLLPASLVPTIISLAHDETGHQGEDKMLASFEPHYWWPMMKAEVENYAKTCKRCVATLAQGHRKALIHQRSKEEKLFALMEINLNGPLRRTKEGLDHRRRKIDKWGTIFIYSCSQTLKQSI
jgi:hypothetical protein